jgi:transposase
VGRTRLAADQATPNYDTDRLIGVLKELRRFLGGEKATLLWDGLPSHRSTAMRNWIRTQRSWLVVERLPAYAPEFNPVEACGPASRRWSWPTWPCPRSPR